MPYQPTDEDVRWAKFCMKMLAHESVLAFPDSQLIYRVDKVNKVLRLVNPELLNEDQKACLIHARTIETFKVIGFTVIEQRDS